MQILFLLMFGYYLFDQHWSFQNFAILYIQLMVIKYHYFKVNTHYLNDWFLWTKVYLSILKNPAGPMIRNQLNEWNDIPSKISKFWVIHHFYLQNYNFKLFFWWFEIYYK